MIRFAFLRAKNMALFLFLVLAPKFWNTGIYNCACGFSVSFPHTSTRQVNEHERESQCNGETRNPRFTPLPSSTCMASKKSEDDDEFEIFTNDQIRYLGKGENAVVRTGAVMLAPSNEFHHFYRNAAIFVHGMGLDENDEYVIRGVLLDSPTPFTVGEMTNSAALKGSNLSENILFRGGGSGSDNAMLLHNQANVGDGEMIGTSGIYEGGLESACELLQASTDKDESFNKENFKFFFNYCEFTESELEGMFNEVIDDENGDAWISVEVPPEVVLADWNIGQAWRRLRKAVAHHWK